jgi:hypothetical protein
MLERIEAKLDKLTELTVKVTVCEDDLKDHEARIRALEDAVKPILVLNKILGVIGGAFIVTLIAFIWSIITHQVTIIVP